MMYDDELHQWAREKRYLELAKHLRDNYSIGDCVKAFSELTGQPFHNAYDIAQLKYYGGHLSDEEFMELTHHWDVSDQFYIDIIKNKENNN